MALILTTAVFFSCILWSGVHSQGNICYEKADILFIMDSSGSIGRDEFQKQLQFAATFINNFQVGITQFSVLRFDSTPSIVIDFDDYKDNSALKNAILNLDYPGGGTDTASALELAREQAFTAARGARRGVPKIAIVSTDGQSNSPNSTAEEARLLKASNVLVLSIGVGSGINKLELQSIATYADDVFIVIDYSQLVSIVYDYSEVVCEIVQQFKCSNQADLFFLLEASSQIPQASFSNERLFVVNISSSFNLNDVHIGAATFGGSGLQKLFNLGQLTDQYQLSQLLLAAVYLGGGTDTDSALKSVISQNLFDTASGGRPDAAKILIVLTDGRSETADQAKQTATQLRLTGVNIITVGVSNPDIAKLKDLVNHPVLDVVTNLANPKVAVDRIQTLTAVQECTLPTTAIRNVSDYCRQHNLENGIHPHPFDCTKFIECTFLKTDIMNCTNHMVYDPVAETCNYPGFVQNPCQGISNPHQTFPPVVITNPPSTTAKPCIKGLLDVLYILDSSNGVSSSDFRQELGDAANLAENFHLGPDSIQFGALSFATVPYDLFNFNQYTEYKPLQEAILNAGYQGGTTNTYLALENALSVISSSNGSRQAAPKLAILFSSGRSADSTRTQQATAALKNAGVHIIVVGYSNPNLQELQAIASTPSEVFVNNFNGLLNAVKVYSNTTCSNDGFCKGIQFSDVIFVLDSSASISSKDYQELLSFVADITTKFTIGPEDIRFGAVTFSTDTVKLFDLKDYISHDQLSSAIKSAAFLNGGTETAQAINFIREQQMFSSANGGRDNATKIVIILTDGRSNSINDTINAALRLKATGVKFISVGIGSKIYEEELRELASDPQSLFVVTEFAALKQLNDSVTKQVCYSTRGEVNVPQYSSLCSDYSFADGKHPNPRDCSTYVQCSSFVTTVINCANGEAYDPIQQRCTDKSSAHRCDDPNYFGPLVTNPPNIEASTSGPVINDITNLCQDHSLADGVYPDPRMCNSFVECTAFITTSQKCPEGLHFNTLNGVCDDVHIVDCQINYHFFDRI